MIGESPPNYKITCKGKSCRHSLFRQPGTMNYDQFSICQDTKHIEMR